MILPAEIPLLCTGSPGHAGDETAEVRTSGFTLVEIMIVVAIIGLLAAIAIPNFIHARATSQTNACINNLRQIDEAKQEWGLELKKAQTATPNSSELQPYMGRGSVGSLPVCPLDSSAKFDTSYARGDLQTPPTCRIAGAGGSIAGGNHILN